MWLSRYHARRNAFSNSSLSKYNPLPRILFFDDFDCGMNGWCELIGNHDHGNLDTVRPIMSDMRPPQISNCSFFDIGTHGSVDGTYALKLATRARKNHMGVAIKRLTSVRKGIVQFEGYFAFKADVTFETGKPKAQNWDGNLDTSIYDFGDFSISNDICEGDTGPRYHCVLRYLNTDHEGNLVQKWMYTTSVEQTTKMQLKGLAGTGNPFDYHTLHPEDWAEVPGGAHAFCFNEVPTKVNWHYLRWQFDTGRRRQGNIVLQINDVVMDLRDLPVPKFEDSYSNLNNLLNFLLDVRTHRDVRNFLYFDSILVSVDW